MASKHSRATNQEIYILSMGKLGSNPLAGLAALGLGGLATPANTGGLNPAETKRNSEVVAYCPIAVSVSEKTKTI
ncbi:hypothetical protein WN51_02013 [Melipona quadrifasciata]|uniref:Uncharacterized protein n=1 Tax=Melipona quadrifasciata TaxID=166423 RepID=A0A0M9AAS5_9HYME|nr:hypothetical protein WN51_02013 [Melipona quadrifasciata]